MRNVYDFGWITFVWMPDAKYIALGDGNPKLNIPIFRIGYSIDPIIGKFIYLGWLIV